MNIELPDFHFSQVVQNREKMYSNLILIPLWIYVLLYLWFYLSSYHWYEGVITANIQLSRSTNEIYFVFPKFASTYNTSTLVIHSHPIIIVCRIIIYLYFWTDLLSLLVQKFTYTFCCQLYTLHSWYYWFTLTN